MSIKFLKDSRGRLYTDAITKKPIAVDMSLPVLSNPATAEDIASGKEAYGADGVMITGSGSVSSGATPYRHTTWMVIKNKRNTNTASEITVTATIKLPTQAKNVIARQFYSSYSTSSTSLSDIANAFNSAALVLYSHEDTPTITETSSGTTVVASRKQSIARGGLAVWLQATYDIDGLSYTRNADGTINLIGDGNCTWLWENYYVTNSYGNIDLAGEFIKMIDLSKSINLTGIGTRVFYYNTDLKKVILPESLESIGDYAFNKAFNLQEIDFGENSQLKSIGNSAFSNTSLSSIILPESLESIGDYAIADTPLIGVINIPSKVSSIGNNPVRGCTGIQGLTVDEKNAVYHSAGNCIIDTANKTVVIGCRNSVIPNDGSVEIIAGEAFNYPNLTELTIPESVVEVKNFGLYMGSSTNKATITMLPTTPPTLESTSAMTSSYINKIIVPVGCGDTYKTATNWSNFASYIEEATA